MPSNGNTKQIVLTFSNAEALVLFEFLSRFSECDRLSVEDQSEERVLWNLQASLEKILSEPFASNYQELLEAARVVVRDKSECARYNKRLQRARDRCDHGEM